MINQLKDHSIRVINTGAKTVVYTIGHIIIALSCIVLITGAPVRLATVDALIEPLINAGWFFVLDLYCPNLKTKSKTVIYTVGHIFIACLCIVTITGAHLSYAMVDAVVEPLINSLWFGILDKIWHDRKKTHDQSLTQIN